MVVASNFGTSKEDFSRQNLLLILSTCNLWSILSNWSACVQCMKDIPINLKKNSGLDKNPLKKSIVLKSWLSLRTPYLRHKLNSTDLTRSKFLGRILCIRSLKKFSRIKSSKKNFGAATVKNEEQRRLSMFDKLDWYFSVHLPIKLVEWPGMITW